MCGERAFGIVAGMSTNVMWQPSLLDCVSEPAFSLEGIRRRFLGDGAWVDHLPGFLTNPGVVFDEILATAPFASHTRPMYDRIVVEPRLTTGRWSPEIPLLVEMGRELSRHYGLSLPSISANLYRDGNDSVAWHGDRIGRQLSETVVCILSLGAPRKFLMRPRPWGGVSPQQRGGGSSVRFVMQPGDLLVMGGTAQRTWDHCVPKCAQAGPRISVMFREPFVY